jgi:triosephosphate isomerase
MKASTRLKSTDIETSSQANLIAEALLTPLQAGAYLGDITCRQLADFRQRGHGPKYVAIGHRTIRYRKADLDAWVDSKVRRSTAERTA